MDIKINSSYLKDNVDKTFYRGSEAEYYKDKGGAYRQFFTPITGELTIAFDHDIAIYEMLGDDASDLWFTSNAAGETVLAINASDFFFYACADEVLLPFDHVKAYYDAYVMQKVGLDPIAQAKVLCLLRKIPPQQAIQDRWKERGLWEDWMDLSTKDTYYVETSDK